MIQTTALRFNLSHEQLHLFVGSREAAGSTRTDGFVVVRLREKTPDSANTSSSFFKSFFNNCLYMLLVYLCIFSYSVYLYFNVCKAP